MSFFTLVCVTQILFALPAYSEDQPPTQFSEARSAYGKRSAVQYDLGPSDPATDRAGFFAALSAVLFGKDRSILEVQSNVTDLLEGESDFYWGGFRVWNTKPTYKDGAFEVSAGLPTVSMRAPILGVPIGPITLRLDAGLAAEATVTAKLIPLISIPVQFTSIRGEFSPKVNSYGFLEGYAKWTILRAGIGGTVELVRADAKVAGQVSLGAIPPTYSFEGFVSLLAGKIYGFVDYFNLFVMKWKRAFKPIISEWRGKCFVFSPPANPGNGSTEGEPCASRP